MSKSFIPSREAELVTWANTFASFVVAEPTDFGVTLEQVATFDGLRIAFDNAYATANNAETRSPANIEAKNDVKRDLIAETRKLVAIIQAWPAMTDTKRTQLGITVRDTDPTPVPVPDEAPQLDVVSVVGRAVKLRLRDAATGNRKKPTGVQGAAVLSYVGTTVPEDMRQWTFEGNTTRLDTPVNFAPTVPTGSKVWFTAFWFNRRGESGPATAPISTHVGFGVTSGAGEGEALQDEAA